MNISRAAGRHPWLASYGVSALMLAGTWAGINVYEAHRHSMFQRYDTSFGHRCLADTAWSTTSTALQHGGGGAALDLATATAKPRLTVFGNTNDHPVPVLTFTARTALGSDQLVPADAATSQVLREHGCPSQTLRRHS